MPKFLKKSMKLNWNFQRGMEGGGLNQKFPFGDLEIFWKNPLCSIIHHGKLFLKLFYNNPFHPKLD